LFWPTSIMPSCDVVPDSTDLGTDRPNLRPITVIDDRFEPIQMPSNVSWVNIPTHTTYRRCRSGEHKASYEFLIEISIINAYKLSLHSDVSKKAKYTVHSEFRTALATCLIQASQMQFLKRKRTSIGPAIERSMIPLEDHQICKRKSSGNCRGCKEIGQLAGSRKRRSLGEITRNLGRSKRGKRSTYGCNICDVFICKDGPCWAAYHHSIKIG